jgi:hypothetical protein
MESMMVNLNEEKKEGLRKKKGGSVYKSVESIKKIDKGFIENDGKRKKKIKKKKKVKSVVKKRN